MARTTGRIGTTSSQPGLMAPGYWSLLVDEPPQFVMPPTTSLAGTAWSRPGWIRPAFWDVVAGSSSKLIEVGQAIVDLCTSAVSGIDARLWDPSATGLGDLPALKLMAPAGPLAVTLAQYIGVRSVRVRYPALLFHDGTDPLATLPDAVATAETIGKAFDVSYTLNSNVEAAVLYRIDPPGIDVANSLIVTPLLFDTRWDEVTA